MGDSKTFRLIKDHSTFLGGVVNLIDISISISSKFNTDKVDQDADTKSLKSDWEAVGIDMYSAIEKYGNSVTKK